MGSGVAARLVLGLLLLALLSPTQMNGQDSYNETTLTESMTPSAPPLVPNSTVNNTLNGHGTSLQSTATLFILSISLICVC